MTIYKIILICICFLACGVQVGAITYKSTKGRMRTERYIISVIVFFIIYSTLIYLIFNA